MKRFLIVIDVQNDFCPGGSLVVTDGQKIIPAVNRLMERGRFDAVIATQDWHPAGHISFASTHGKKPFEQVRLPYGGQLVWPDHCLQGTAGAALHPDLKSEPIRFIIRKGFRRDMDSYSAFFENDKKTATGLSGLLAGLAQGGKFELYLAGIATDVCVLNTALDAKTMLRYDDVRLVEDACAGVTPDGTAAAVERMRSAGIKVVKTADAG
jgi:nicotinamidase/pyrazinamidase